MKIKTQLMICIVVFSVILLVIGASVVTTEQQVAQITAQEDIASNIERGASSLNSIAMDYFLYQEDLQLSRWESSLSSLSIDLSNLKPNSPQQQTLASNVADDLQRLNTLFDEVSSYLQSASRNVSVRIDPPFQIRWSSMAVQSQALAFDASQLSLSLDDQARQVNTTNALLIISLMGVFGAFLATIYLMVFRRTLKSVAELQNGINTIGSGNLEYVIETKREDEIAELSHSFNQMTTNLKSVTASKTELEKEIAVRKKAEYTVTRQNMIQEGINKIFQEALSTRSEEALGEICLAVAKEVTESEYGFIDEVSENGLHSIAISNPGWDACEMLDASGHRKILGSFKIHGIYGRIITDEKGFFTNDPANHPDSIGLPKGHPPLKAFLGIPMRSEGKTIGLIAVANHEGGYSQVELGALEVLAPAVVEAFLRKRAEEAIRRQASLIDLSPDAIIVMKPGGTITFWSRGAEKLYGWTKTEAVGQTSHDLLKTSFSKPLSNISSQVRITGQWSGELQHKTKDGRDVIVQSHWLGEREEQGALKSILESNVDITERKRLQEKLEDSATQLEEYASQMEQLANERAQKLKDAERLATIGATAGMVGHDIRNPLQSITGDLYLAKQDLISLPQSEEKESIKESLEAIEKSVDYVNKIVVDLQDFARPLNPRVEETDLNIIINDLLTKNGLPDNVKVKVKIAKENQTLLTDSAYMKRILGNLITNAVQAMPNGGKLAINATAKDNDTIITVQDTGVGITEEAKPKLFTPLFTTKSRGQGFGLSVVKRMTEALNGSVTFESQQGKGTKFTIQIPTKAKSH